MPKGEKRKTTPKKIGERSSSANRRNQRSNDANGVSSSKRTKFVEERPKRHTRANSIEAKFDEGDQVVDICVRGQYSEFNEENTQNANAEEGEIVEDTNSEDDEITFHQRNNNATTRMETEIDQSQSGDLDTSKNVSIHDVQNLIQQSQKQTADMLQKQFVDLQKNFLHQQQEQIIQMNEKRSVTTEQPKHSENSPQIRSEINKRRNHGNGNQGTGCYDTTDVSANIDEVIAPESVSEVTVYTNAVKNGNLERRKEKININSSSEEENLVDTSDEFANDSSINIEQIQQKAIIDFIAAARNDSREVHHDQNKQENRSYNDNRPSTSTQGAYVNHRQSPRERGEQLIREAETAKAKIYEVPGTNDLIENNLTTQFMRSALMDESFLLVASHLDSGTHEKIIKGEYVDFARLIPKDRILAEEDNRMQLVMKGNDSYWVPASSAETTVINSFSKWEQAFRVFSDVYTRAHPSRASELVQYNHVIHTAAMAYVWENVYLYDKDFRLHIARNTERSWALLLQQSWSLRLKDKLSHHGNSMYNSHNNQNQPSDNKNQGCKRFNRGRCTYGMACRYEHRCFYCNKFGHGVVVCRSLKNDTQSRNGTGYNNNNDRKDNFRTNQQHHGNYNSNQNSQPHNQSHNQSHPHPPARQQLNNVIDKKINSVAK